MPLSKVTKSWKKIWGSRAYDVDRLGKEGEKLSRLVKLFVPLFRSCVWRSFLFVLMCLMIWFRSNILPSVVRCKQFSWTSVFVLLICTISCGSFTTSPSRGSLRLRGSGWMGNNTWMSEVWFELMNDGRLERNSDGGYHGKEEVCWLERRIERETKGKITCSLGHDVFS